MHTHKIDTRQCPLFVCWKSFRFLVLVKVDRLSSVIFDQVSSCSAGVAFDPKNLDLGETQPLPTLVLTTFTADPTRLHRVREGVLPLLQNMPRDERKEQTNTDELSQHMLFTI